MGIVQIVIILLALFALSIPVGKYIYKIITGEKSFVDPVMDKVDNAIYKITGVKKDQEMDWKRYAIALVLTNVILTFVLFAILRLQNYLGLNPNGIGSMEQSLSFNEAISFITNTNFQSYSGESGASYFVQMILTSFMFIAPATGLAFTAAFLRGIIGKTKNLGNFFVDLIRFITRLLLPLSIVIALFLVWQGVPQTLSANRTVNTIEGTQQDIALGPVASLESIKNLGSNGGGFFNANSAHPFENPTPMTNFVTILSLGLIATATVVAFGYMLKNKKQALVLFGVAAFLLVLSVGVVYYAESAGNPVLAKAGLSQSMGNMEGKEMRFSLGESSLFVAATTAYQVGAVSSMHDSLTPLGGMAAMWNMMIQTAFGGKGTGFVYLVMFAILAVFLCGLMVGRTPEFLGKKIEGREIKMVAIAILLHPVLILIPTAISLIIPQAAASISNAGFHGLSQILYNFSSASANNGSAFAGMTTNTVYYNVFIGIVMLIGRYVPIVTMLAVAGSMASKKLVPVSVGTFKTDNTIFAVVLLGVILIVGALTFFPALALGPIAEHLTLR
jgi:potassium-transporting ATPase potassium-binding subunit